MITMCPGDRKLPFALALLFGTLATPIGGCAPARFPLVDNCATVPPGAIPTPNDESVRRFGAIQAEKAEADDFVFYRREFALGGIELGPGGTRHLADLFPRLPTTRCPIVIEPDPENPGNDLPRREAIVARLAAIGLSDPDVRVVVAYPQAEGIYADQGPAIYNQIVNPRTGGAGGIGGINGGVGGAGGLGGGGAGGLGGGGGAGVGGVGGFGGGLPF